MDSGEQPDITTRTSNLSNSVTNDSNVDYASEKKNLEIQTSPSPYESDDYQIDVKDLDELVENLSLSQSVMTQESQQNVWMAMQRSNSQQLTTEHIKQSHSRPISYQSDVQHHIAQAKMMQQEQHTSKSIYVQGYVFIEPPKCNITSVFSVQFS